MNDRRCVGVWRHRWLPVSETFIRDQVAALQTWRALTIGRYQMDTALVRADLAPFRQSAASRIRLRLLPASIALAPIKNALRDADAEIIHAHFATEGASVVPLSKSLDLPLVVTCHGYDVTASLPGLSRFHRLAVLDSVFCNASRLIAVSEFIADELVRRGAPPDKVVVHHIGINTDLPDGIARAGNGAARREPVLFAGRFVEKKGVTDLIQAYAMLPAQIRSDAPLLLAGDGEGRREAEALASGLGVDVTFLGWQEPAALRQLMAQAAVFCAPSRTASDGDSEGFGLVFLEAALCGTPSVAYHHGGVPEAVVDGTTGLLVDEGDVRALSHSLRALLEDRSLAARLGMNGRARVLEHFDINKTTAGLEAIYEAVAAG